jgi:hypothetical protein
MSWCVVKMGERGALLGDRTTGRVHRQAGYKVEVEDTVGCGDSFAAAIALGFGLCKRGEADIESTLALAGAVGAATAMGVGAGRKVADVSRVREILAHSESSEKIQGALRMIDSHEHCKLRTRIAQLRESPKTDSVNCRQATRFFFLRLPTPVAFFLRLIPTGHLRP